MSEDNSALWNALETLIEAWAHKLADSLETNTEPDWDALSSDLAAAGNMAYILRDRAQRRERELSEWVLLLRL